MKNTRWLVCVGMVTILAGGALAAREGGSRRGGGRNPEVDLLEELVRECKITAEQQADVKAKIEARDKVLAEWDKANAEKLAAAEAASKDARSKNDDDAKKKASAAMKELQTARTEAAAEAAAAVLTALTPEQKAAWAGYELFKSTTGRYRKAELTEEQLKQARAACAFAAKELAEIGEDGKAQKTLAAKLRWAIEAVVLTAAQREALGIPAARKGKNQ